MIDNIGTREYAALERKYDGAIPPYLLTAQTEAQMMADHHKAMIRFHKGRQRDFEESHAKILSWPDTNVAKVPWAVSTEKCIRFHIDEIARHEREIAQLEVNT